MNPFELLAKVKSEPRNTLTEAESKKLLAAYGVPVIREKVANNAEEAVKAAEEMGWPVVLKGLGARLTHKTERGLVRLNIDGPKQLREAADDVSAAAGDDLEGFLIQPQLHGRREFVAGLFRDRGFGLVIMVGLAEFLPKL